MPMPDSVTENIFCGIRNKQLIESATDMSTHEKLNAMDKNCDCRNQER